MTTNLYDAHRQWAARPPDERFTSLDALHAFARTQRAASREVERSLKQTSLVTSEDGSMAVNGRERSARLTNWAFGQLCTTVGAPAKYLRVLPADLAQKCLSHGLVGSNRWRKLLLREVTNTAEKDTKLWVSAFTSLDYGRIWDVEVIESLMSAVEDTGWHVPPARSSNESSASGLYASDRDMFVFLVNDDSPVEVGNARLGRGFFCWNSETGASAFGLTTFLYNYVCGNHIVWGAEQVKELRIVHNQQGPARFNTDALPALNRFVENPSFGDKIKDTVGQAMSTRIGETFEDVLKWSESKPLSRHEVTRAWETAVADGENATTVWGIVQGLTSFARRIPYTNTRVNLERRAGSLLRLAA